jgi:hypothetical protein
MLTGEIKMAMVANLGSTAIAGHIFEWMLFNLVPNLDLVVENVKSGVKQALKALVLKQLSSSDIADVVVPQIDAAMPKKVSATDIADLLIPRIETAMGGRVAALRAGLVSGVPETPPRKRARVMDEEDEEDLVGELGQMQGQPVLEHPRIEAFSNFTQWYKRYKKDRKDGKNQKALLQALSRVIPIGHDLDVHGESLTIAGSR